MKKIETLLKDIDNIFVDPNHKVSEDNLKLFMDNLGKVVKDHIEKSGTDKESYLRMSMIGLPDRKLYFELKFPAKGNQVNSQLQQRMLFGHVVEQLLFFLAREAGHTVDCEQMEVVINGVKGHLDARIDGVITDSKSVSPYQFPKFYSPPTLKANDSFGYVPQIGGYHTAAVALSLTSDERAAILALNKSDGEKRLLFFDEMDWPNIPQRIDHIKAMLDKPEPPPELCYQPVPKGKSGNEVLHPTCKYCRHKFKCHKNIRVFGYSNGLEFFTKVLDTPSVQEIQLTDEQKTQQEEAESYNPEL